MRVLHDLLAVLAICASALGMAWLFILLALQLAGTQP